MSDQLPSKECLNFSWSWDAEARNWRISMVDMGNGFMAGYDHLALYYERRLIQEIERLRTALTGISTCSTCEACRGAALRALRGDKFDLAFEIMEAENMETCNPDWCPTCTKPYSECRCNGESQ